MIERRQDLTADLVADAVRGYASAVGVVIRDIARLLPTPAYRALRQVVKEGRELRLAYLDTQSTLLPLCDEFDAEHITRDVEQAERWRNQRDLTGLIVVIARGDQAKLTSLEDFYAISSKDLKAELVARALGAQAGANDVQARWWSILGSDERVSLGQLVDYFEALQLLNDVDFKEQSPRQMHLLGLLPDPGLLDSPGEVAIRRRVDENRDLVRRLQLLVEGDRKSIADNIEKESDPATQDRLRLMNFNLRSLRRGTGTLEAFTLAGAKELLGIRVPAKQKQGPGPGPEAPPHPRERLRDFAAAALVESPLELPQVERVLEEMAAKLDELAESSSRTQRVLLQTDGLGELLVEARGDVLNLIAKLVDDGVYGGLVQTEATDSIEDGLRRFRAEQDVIRRWSRTDVARFLSSFSHPKVAQIAELFAAFDAAREPILPLMAILATDPLTVAAVPTKRELLLVLVRSYHALFDALRDAYPDLLAAYGSEADEFVGYLLALETIVFRGVDGVLAMVTPMHPLYLWHYAEYCRIVEEQRDRLSEEDRQLVIDGAKNLQNFLTSLCVPYIAAEKSVSLPQIGKLGPIPYYGDRGSVPAGAEGIDAIRTLVSSFTDLYPPSRFGLRLALLDPPDPSAVLSLCCDLQERAELSGASVHVFQHRRTGASSELQLPSDEEERIARTFRGTSEEHRFTYETGELPQGQVGLPPEFQAHIAIAFDQTPLKTNRAQATGHSIQPLAMTQRLRYRALSGTVDLEPAPGGIFAAYDGVIEYFDKSAQQSYFASHQEHALRTALREAAGTVTWYVLVDRGVDRDLELGRLRVFSGHQKGREIVAFASSSEPFRRVIREVVRQYNTAITDADLNALLDELSDLLDGGVLALRPDHAGRVNEAGVKGLLGTLIAARWYRRRQLDEKAHLLVSLDSPEARKWLHLAPDPHRADLLGFTFSNGDLFVDVVEVKTRQQVETEYQVANGIASGPAIDQLVSTTQLIGEVFATERDSELITTPARREVLREHVHRELTKRLYSPDERNLWVQRLEPIFAGAEAPVTRSHLVEVHLGVDKSSLRSRDVRMRRGSELVALSLVQLNEEGVEALQPAIAAAPKTTDPGELASTPMGRNTAKTEVSYGPTPADATEALPDGPPRPALRPRAYLGNAPGPYGRPREVWFDPELPSQPLPNPHIAITGETGSGKTQAIKAIMTELGLVGLPSLIMDFKDDYSQPDYAAAEKIEVYSAGFGGLPFNPMVPPIDPRSGQVSLMNHVHQLGEIVKRIYRLGDQQAYRFREALKGAYDTAGLPTQPFVPNATEAFPGFDVIHAILVESQDNEALLGRLSPIFDLELFSSVDDEAAFSRLLDGSAVIRLSQLPGDEVKNAVAEFFLMALYNHLIRQAHPHALRRLLVLDEAWRLVESPFLEPLMREGRAFGLGVLLASQFPKDLPLVVAGSTKTNLFFSQTKPENIREVQRALVGKTSGPDAEHVASTLRALPPLSCLVQNPQYDPYVRVALLPYFERAAAGERAARGDERLREE